MNRLWVLFIFQMGDHFYKLVVFGAGAVGKSALTIQFVRGYFISDYDPTIEDSYKRALAVDDGNIQLDILDTAGQDDFAPLRTSYMRQGEGFILVYAIDDRASFEEVEVLHRDLIRTKGRADLPVVICGNKCDLEDRRVVSKTEGEELADNLRAKFFETSALDDVNIEDAFRALVREIRKKSEETSKVSENSDSVHAKKDRKRRRKRCDLI